MCVQEKTVTEKANFSSVARDFVDLVVKVCKSCDMHVTAKYMPTSVLVLDMFTLERPGLASGS